MIVFKKPRLKKLGGLLLMKVSYKVMTTAALATVVAAAGLAAPQAHAAEAVTIDSVVFDVKGTKVVVSLTDYNMAIAFPEDNQALLTYLKGGNENAKITALVVNGKTVDLGAYNTEYVFSGGVVDSDILATFLLFLQKDSKNCKGMNEDGTARSSEDDFSK